ncbi:MAG: hypothetical protein QOD76_1854 [Solirubrobacteraceae bacterium]|nr:hypothetical protein [Solirubrobacteraceae bacterium]
MTSLRRRPARLSVSALATGLAIAVAGCGGSSGSGNSNADPATIAPAASALYASAVIRPEGDQKAAIESIARKFGVNDPGRAIERALDRSTRRGSKTNFKDDIKPWLGKRAALVLTNFNGRNPDGAVIVATMDTGKAKDAIRKDQQGHRVEQRSYRGVDYDVDTSGGRDTPEGIVRGFAVVGLTEAGYKAVIDASKGKSITGSGDFRQARQRGEGKLGFAYLDLKGTLGGLASSGQLGSQAQGLQILLGGATPRSVVATLEAQSDRVTLEFATAATAASTGLSGQTPLVAALPGDAWAALGVRNLGPGIKQLFNTIGSGLGGAVLTGAQNQLQRQYGIDLQRDVFAAIGDVAAFTRGTSALTVGGGVVIQSPSPAAARRLISKLGALVRRQGAAQGVRVSSTSIAGASGIKVTARRLPGAINAVVKGNKFVIAYGDPATEDALSPSSKLGDAGGFKAAIEALGGASPSLYVAFAPILSLADSVSSNSASYKQARPYLAAIDTFAIGGRKDGNLQVARVVVSVK